MDPSPVELRRLLRWRTQTFWVMLLGYVGYYLCRANLAPAFPLLERAFGYTNSELAQMALLSEIAYAAGKLVNGPLADRFGGRRIFLIGMAGAIAANVAFAASSDLLRFTVIWCVCRYFLSMGWGGVVKTIGAWYEVERIGTVMGLVSVNFQLGGVVAPLVAGVLVDWGSPWQSLFLVPAGMLALVLVASAALSREQPSDVVPGVTFPPGQGSVASVIDRAHEAARAARGEGAEPCAPGAAPARMGALAKIRALLAVGAFRHLLVFSFLTTLLRSVFLTWTPKFLVDVGYGDAKAIFQSALFPALGCIGTVLLGWYTDRFARDGDRAPAMCAMLVLLAACLFAIAALAPNGSAHSLWIGVLLGASGFFLLGPYSMSSGCLTLDIAGHRAAGSASGMIDGVGYVGGALGAYGAGILADALGWGEVFAVLGIAALMSVASAFGLSRSFRRAARARHAALAGNVHAA